MGAREMTTLQTGKETHTHTRKGRKKNEEFEECALYYGVGREAGYTGGKDEGRRATAVFRDL